MIIRFFFKALYKYYKLKNKFYRKKDKEINLGLPELPLVVLITSFNNEKYCEKNLKSVFEQNYSNFEVIYVDDCSNDNTVELVENFLKEQNFSKFTLVKNKERKKKLANLYETIHKISDDKIILELDGDDYLVHKDVLKTFNSKFNNGTLIVHANYINNPPEFAKNIEIFAQKTPYFVKKFNLFRNYPWIYSGLRAYYAKLFKQIKIECLITKHPDFYNKFFPVSHDMAVFYPMLEMANKKIEFIEESLLIRNIDSPINDFKIYDYKLRNEINNEILIFKNNK